MLRVSCPETLSGSSCRVTGSGVRVKLRGRSRAASVAAPVRIAQGDSARLKVREAAKTRRLLLKGRKSGVSSVWVKVVSGNGGKLLRQTVRNGLMR